MIAGLISKQTVNEKINLIGTCVGFIDNSIFFSKVKSTDTYLKFEDIDFQLVFKCEKNVINDVYCSDWTQIKNYSFNRINTIFI